MTLKRCQNGRGLLGLLCLMVIFGGSGCAAPLETAGKLGQVIWDPSTPVGHPEDRPSTASLSLLADEDVNPNALDEGTPLMFRVLQLKDDSMLMAADYDELEGDLEDALGTNYLSHDDFTLLPGQFKVFQLEALDSDSRYLGVVAYYAEPDRAQWKKVLRVQSRGQDYHFLVRLRRHEAELKDED
ncbi:type VI secretion system protein VasD [Alkalispirillum mobile]|uniref:Type VI secretion system protein VasD n=1 Tax=Alkalispirillum mobile TaxID=85925 RepID=A0A498C972_9GAMM|nr:type VI secretion system lipoprotein TssJ [Alkalispirillum mobile]RLK51709.1 type VI secretion system protein VasD [Alkalispirillum mobile]